MMGRRQSNLVGAGALALLLSACAGGDARPDRGAPVRGGPSRGRPVSDTPVKIGRPYSVRGNTYVPRADADYDMLGYASWYGSESGNMTANGERFHPSWITAAHRTLPLPTYVEVTALDTGRRILVRINDRGPFSESKRIIDLSRGAAELLGVRAMGVARVRVQRVEPSGEDRERLRSGGAARELDRVSGRVLRNLRDQFAESGM